MSLELILVFALTAPPSTNSVQAALDRHGIPIRFSQTDDLHKHKGFLPLSYASRKSGFYVTHLTYKELLSDYPEAKLTTGLGKSVISLGWGGNFLECASVFQVASVLVSEFGAQAFDAESSGYMPIEDIKSAASECYEESKKQQTSE
jgi:hypothetical protein